MRQYLIKKEKILNIILVLSIICCNQLVTLDSTKLVSILSALIVGIVAGYVLFHKQIIHKIVQWKPVIKYKVDYWLCIFLGIQTSQILLRYFTVSESFMKSAILKFAAICNIDNNSLWLFGQLGLQLLSIPFLCLLWFIIIHYCLPKIISFFKSFSKIEKRYFIVASAISLILITWVNLNTTAFTTPFNAETENLNLYDILYTTDNGIQINRNSFQNFNAPENDLRQPLFAVFAFPFGMIANIGAEIFNFFPQTTIYSFLIICLQGIVLIVCSILLSRLISKEKSGFFLIFYSLMFVTVFFMLNAEQYVFGLFWLIILIYYFVEKKKSNPLLFSAATGSLMTNIVLLPYIVFKKNWRQFIQEGIKYGLIFCFLIILCGQTGRIINCISGFEVYQRSMGMDVSFMDRLYQYINFIASCFIAPKAMIDYSTFEHVSYQLQVSTGINILGFVLIMLMIASFVLNRKNQIAQISFGWLLFSFIILCLIGWGTAENGLIIYGIYFSWAYFILIALLLKQFLEKIPRYKTIVWCIIFIIMIYLNGKELWNIVEFGKEHYPFHFMWMIP